MARWLVVLVAAAALLVASAAVAQPPGGRPGGPRGPGMMMAGPGMGFGGGSALGLLRLEQVRKELELVDDQVAKLNQLAEKLRSEMRERFSGLRDLSPEERRAKMQELGQELRKRNEELEAEVKKILLPHQLTRLEEIRLQLMGLRALDDPKVAEALGITEEQKAKMQQIREQAREKMRSLFEQMRGMRDLTEEERAAKREELRKQFQEARQGVEKKILDVLSDEQKETFEKMKGEPFKLDLEALRGQRRPGPAGGPGRRPGRGPGRGGPAGGR